MKLMELNEKYEAKTGITQDTIYIHGPTRWVNKVAKIDLPIYLFRHDKNNLEESLNRIVDSEVIVLNLTEKDGLDIVLPLLYRSKNQFSTELLICFDNYPYSNIFCQFFDKDPDCTFCKNPDELIVEIKKFFSYLGN